MHGAVRDILGEKWEICRSVSAVSAQNRKTERRGKRRSEKEKRLDLLGQAFDSRLSKAPADALDDIFGGGGVKSARPGAADEHEDDSGDEDEQEDVESPHAPTVATWSYTETKSVLGQFEVKFEGTKTLSLPADLKAERFTDKDTWLLRPPTPSTTVSNSNASDAGAEGGDPDLEASLDSSESDLERIVEPDERRYLNWSPDGSDGSRNALDLEGLINGFLGQDQDDLVSQVAETLWDSRGVEFDGFRELQANLPQASFDVLEVVWNWILVPVESV